MKTKIKILFYLLLFVLAVFLGSCDSEKKQSAESCFSLSHIDQILKMQPVKITISDWIGGRLTMETEEEFREAFANPKNWSVFFETTDVNQINKIMAALAKPPIKPGGFTPPFGSGCKMSFEYKGGLVRCTLISSEGKQTYLPDRVYGEETYNVFVKILNPGPNSLPRKEPNRPE